MKIGNITIGVPVPEMAKSVTVMQCLVTLNDRARCHSVPIIHRSQYTHRLHWLKQIVIRIAESRLAARHAAAPQELRADRFEFHTPAVVRIDTENDRYEPVTAFTISWRARRAVAHFADETITFRYCIGHFNLHVTVPSDPGVIMTRSLRAYINQLTVFLMSATLPNSILDPPVRWSQIQTEELIQRQVPDHL